MHGVADPCGVRDGDSHAFDPRGAHQLVEHRPCRAARQIDGRGRSAELLNDPGRIDAAAAGVVALAPGPHLVDRSNRLCLCRSEEHTSELQSLMRISYAVLCLKKKTQKCILTD